VENVESACKDCVLSARIRLMSEDQHTCHKAAGYAHNTLHGLPLFQNLIKSKLCKAHGDAARASFFRGPGGPPPNNLIVLLSVLPLVVSLTAGGSPYCGVTLATRADTATRDKTGTNVLKPDRSRSG